MPLDFLNMNPAQGAAVEITSHDILTEVASVLGVIGSYQGTVGTIFQNGNWGKLTYYPLTNSIRVPDAAYHGIQGVTSQDCVHPGLHLMPSAYGTYYEFTLAGLPISVSSLSPTTTQEAPLFATKHVTLTLTGKLKPNITTLEAQKKSSRSSRKTPNQYLPTPTMVYNPNTWTSLYTEVSQVTTNGEVQW